MTTGPKIPREQRSFGDHGALSIADAATADSGDQIMVGQSSQPGEADVKLKEQGRFGNLNQNLTAIRNVQER